MLRELVAELDDAQAPDDLEAEHLTNTILGIPAAQTLRFKLPAVHRDLPPATSRHQWQAPRRQRLREHLGTAHGLANIADLTEAELDDLHNWHHFGQHVRYLHHHASDMHPHPPGHDTPP